MGNVTINGEDQQVWEMKRLFGECEKQRKKERKENRITSIIIIILALVGAIFAALAFFK